MSGQHLPECWATYPSDPPAWCICDELRACEVRATAAAVQRVEALANEMRNWSSAETTAATESVPDLTFDQWLWAQRGVLRCIAAIKGEQP
jgi:hypothetical protein